MKKPQIYVEARASILHRGEHVPEGTVVEVEENSVEHVDLMTSGRCKLVTRDEFAAFQRRPKGEKAQVAVA